MVIAYASVKPVKQLIADRAVLTVSARVQQRLHIPHPVLQATRGYWWLATSYAEENKSLKLKPQAPGPGHRFYEEVRLVSGDQGCAEARPRHYEAAQVLEAEDQRCRSRQSRRPVKDTDSATTLLGLGSHHLGAAGYHHWCWTSTSRLCRPWLLCSSSGVQTNLLVETWC